MDISIAGGGLGGLAAAAALHQDGHTVTVFERSLETSQGGAGIGIAPQGVRALDRIGLGEAVRALTVPGDGDGTTRDRNGRPLIQVDHEALAANGQDPLVSLPRRTLAALLHDQLPEDTVRAPAAVVNADPASGLVETDSEKVPADVVVAADGARSRIRRTLVVDHPGLRRSGELAAQAIVPDLGQDVSPIIGELMDHRTGARFGCLPMAEGTVYWYALWPAGANAPGERTDRSQVLEWLRWTRYDWHPLVGDLLAKTDPATMHVAETAALARPLPSFALDRVALLGDAAHAMTPDLGQGATQAFADAIALADCLKGADRASAPARLRRYDALRRPPTSRMLYAAWATQKFGTLRGGLGMLRDQAMRMIPPGLATRMMAG